jgi:hypothetical protein
LVQEIKDYSDLECQFSEVMDSNDSCTPTSKKDPSYYTLLEFLQQFLPKGLHQTIDDKKGREIRLRLSEPKDEEALGDMETASTSTKENRDKEMDERQCVVQHVGCNVDQEHDMLTEEAHKLQTFLRQNIEMDQRCGSSTIFPNLHELHSKFLKDASIFVGVRENVEVDSIEFLFLDAQCMSKVVGVGLHQALVTVTNDNDVKVEALSESAWESLLVSMFMKVEDSGGFELIGFRMPKMEEDNIKSMSLPLPSKDVAKQFGVGLKDFHGNHFITMNMREENMFFPVIWEVTKEYKALKEGDPHVTKRPSGVGSSTGASGASSSGSSEQGKEEGKSVRSWSLQKSSNWWEYGKGDEKDDEGKPPGGDPPPNSGPSSEPEMVPRTYTVKVYPEAGRKFCDAREIPPEIKTASMKPKLTIVFFRDKTGDKFLNVTTQTQCNLGCDADTKHYFGWFQDDIKISFRGSSLECEGTELKDFSASVQGGEKGELTKETTNITLGGSTSVANLESRGMFGQGMIAGFGMQVQVREVTTNTFGQNSSRADTEEIVGVKQIEGFNVHNHNFEEDLIYKFCIPTRIRNSNDPMRFLRYKDTFTPIIVGKWDVSKENAFEAANYIFKVERHLVHIEQDAVTLGRGCPQDYVLEMFINLAMTHLDGLRSDKTIEIRERSFVGPAIQVFPVQ